MDNQKQKTPISNNGLFAQDSIYLRTYTDNGRSLSITYLATTVSFIYWPENNGPGKVYPVSATFFRQAIVQFLTQVIDALEAGVEDEFNLAQDYKGSTRKIRVNVKNGNAAIRIGDGSKDVSESPAFKPTIKAYATIRRKNGDVEITDDKYSLTYFKMLLNDLNVAGPLLDAKQVKRIQIKSEEDVL